jgi:hypothetical protein
MELEDRKAAAAALLHNIDQLVLDVAEHTGESTGNLDMLRRRIEDQVKELCGLPVVQPELPHLQLQEVAANFYEQQLRKVHAVVLRYIVPVGISKHEAMTEITGLVDPWPVPRPDCRCGAELPCAQHPADGMPGYDR